MTRLSALAPGAVLIADGGFPCLDEGAHLTVIQGKGGLAIMCRDGEHLLDGQVSADGDTLVGLRRLTRRDKSKAATTAKVLDAARALFAADGYVNATIRGIAKAAGMSTGAVFANYEDKAAIYVAAYGHKPLTAEQGRALAGHLNAVLAAGVGTPEADAAAAYLAEAGLTNVQPLPVADLEQAA